MAFETARQTLGRTAQSQSKIYDRKVRPGEVLNVDDLVLYYLPRKHRGLSPKWQRLFIGPLRVIRKIDDYNDVVKKPGKQKALGGPPGQAEAIQRGRERNA